LDTHAPTRRRTTRFLVIIAVVAALSVPVAVLAAGGHFTDDDTSVFESHINWMADAGITLGCNPPTNDHYCPDANVTRGEMAAFMHRFAQYIDAEDGTPAEADNASTLDGLDSTDLQPMRALVKGSDGSIIAQSGGISAVRGYTGGQYLDFGTDISGHGLVATLQWANGGFISAAVCGGNTDETVNCVVGDNTQRVGLCGDIRRRCVGYGCRLLHRRASVVAVERWW
jgi:hypothetical protein